MNVRDATRPPSRGRRPRGPAPGIAVTCIALLLATLGAPPAAMAHGFGAPDGLPIPQWLFAWGATLVLLASFFALSLLWRRPTLARSADGRGTVVPAWATRTGEAVLGSLAVATFGLTVWAGLLGAQTPASNPTPSIVFAVVWIGVPALAVLVGDVWRVLSPWAAVGRLCGRLARPLLGDAPPLHWPERVGQWPATATLVGFVLIELLTTIPTDPSVIAVLLLVYAAVMLAGQSLFGVEVWSRNADGMAALSRIFGALAPLVIDRARVGVRIPGSGTTRLDVVPGSTALVLTILVTTTFDGFTNTALWGERPGLASALDSLGEALGLSARGTVLLSGVLGLMLVSAIVVSLIMAGGAAMRRRMGGSTSTAEIVRVFSPTFAPIALAYLVAHYWTFLVVQVQVAVALISDPLTSGADLFGTAGMGVGYGILQGAGVWYVQVAVLLAGHVMALVLAHDLALERSRGPKAAARSQQPMLVVMVALTTLGLWLLAA